MSGRPGRAQAAWPVWAYLFALAADATAVLHYNFPGHLSWDSVSALYEGRFHRRETWNPAIYGWLLGALDRVSPDAEGFIGLSCLLLFGAWAAMAGLGRRVSWLAAVVALAVLALPQVLIYPAIYWKDVLASETAIAGFVALAWAARYGLARANGIALGLAAVLLAAAGLFRQNGLIFALAGGAALAFVGRGAGPRRSLLLAGGWVAAVLALALAFSALLRPEGPGPPDSAGARGVRLVQAYDVIAGLSLQPGRTLTLIDRAEPAAAKVLETRGVELYAPERMDPLLQDPAVASALERIPPAQIRAEWVRLIRHDPFLYLRARWAAFRQVFATPDIDRCLAVEVGVDGPPKILQALRIDERWSPADQRLQDYADAFSATPAMSHVIYAGVALVAMIALLFRGSGPDIMIAALLAGALAFAASFFVISIACDYRYLYVLDMAAVTGVLHLAIDPRMRRR